MINRKGSMMNFQLGGFDYGLKQAQDFQELKFQLHQHLIAEIERDHLGLLDLARELIADYVREKVIAYVADRHLPISGYDLDNLVEEVVDELAGYGPLESLIRDDRINDILVNGPKKIFIERDGRLETTNLRFIDNEHVLRVIRRILAHLGRRIDEASPMVDARLPDGSRVNAIIPPLALDGPCLSIRKFRKQPLLSADLLQYGTLDEEMLSFLTAAVERRCNLIVSGGTGAGKTTLLNVLSRFIPPNERIVTIEDAAELQLEHEHVVRLETRPSNIDGNGEITARELVKNSLRMRPDRIVLGEVRGEEVMDVLQAMNTGHDGCMSTVHANTPEDAMLRFEMLAGLAKFQGTEGTLRKMITAAIELVVQIARMPNGQRKVVSITEIAGVRDGHFVLNELYAYDAGNGNFAHPGVRPCNRKLQNLPFRRQ
ncbi:CpaF family protein [Methylophilus luteus]|jgi:pilus assembly protein CpaF|uniref:CpaF family protein n=1 Tax=Methylophilus luteus TaxID=640108 RepID=A0ABW3FAR0_9PROT